MGFTYIYRWKKWGKGTTACCPFTLPPTTQVMGQVTGYTHEIKDSVKRSTVFTTGNAEKKSAKIFQDANMLVELRDLFKLD